MLFSYYCVWCVTQVQTTTVPSCLHVGVIFSWQKKTYNVNLSVNLNVLLLPSHIIHCTIAVFPLLINA